MSVAALTLWSLALLGPPALPPDIEDLPPAGGAEAPLDPPPASEDVGGVGEVDSPPPAAVEPPPADQAIEITPEAAPVEVEPVAVEPVAVEPVAVEPAAVEQPAPSVLEPSSPSAAEPPTPTPKPTPAPIEGPASPASEPQAQAEQEPEAETSYKKLGGFRLFRFGIAPKIGYTNGTSAKNGLYDRDKSISDSIDNMMVTASGAGDLGTTRFGGFSYGFIADAEVVGINVWVDFYKFFQPGGMWSLLLGYDHEFGLGKRVRLDVGAAGGLNHVFLGSALADLYYDKSNPEAVNIGTLGVEGRAMVDLHIKLVGPLYTGPYALLGYHYLWSANVEEVTAEKGLHYSVGWSLRLDFAAPKLIGGRKKTSP